jgi:hypothetical protein
METEEIISIFTSEDLQERIFLIKAIFIGVSAFLLGMIFFLLIKSKWINFLFWEDLVGFLTFKPTGVGKFTKRWRKVTGKLKDGSEESCKTAVLEAEEMLMGVLEKLGYKGETFQEKMKNLPETAVSNKAEMERALATRNEIVYNPDYNLSLQEAEKVLAIFEQAMKDLQVF